MNWPLVGALLAAGAVWLLLPDPRAGLARLSRDGDGVDGGWWTRALAGREGAPGVRLRALLGVAAAAIVALALPGEGPWAVGAGVAVGAAVLLGAGWVWPVPGPDREVGEQLPGTLDLLAACLEAGAPMRTAVETVAGVSEPATSRILERVAGQLRLGRAESESWLELAEDHWWGAVARDVARSARSGTSLVGALRVHAEDARRGAAAERTRRARTVGVRSVLPLMACFLPAFVLVGVVPVIAGLLSAFFT